MYGYLCHSHKHVPCVSGLGSGDRLTMQSLGGPDWNRVPGIGATPWRSDQTGRAARPAASEEAGWRIGMPLTSSCSDTLVDMGESRMGLSIAAASNPTIVEKVGEAPEGGGRCLDGELKNLLVGVATTVNSMGCCEFYSFTCKLETLIVFCQIFIPPITQRAWCSPWTRQGTAGRQRSGGGQLHLGSGPSSVRTERGPPSPYGRH